MFRVISAFCIIIVIAIAAAQGQQVGSRVTAKSPQAALDEDKCSFYAKYRTTLMELQNNTPYGLDIWFAQGISTEPLPNSDFVADTGLFIAAMTQGGPGDYKVDPCRAGGFERPIQATTCKGTAKLVTDTAEMDVQLPDDNAPKGATFNECGWKIDLQNQKPVATSTSKSQQRPAAAPPPKF
ncbi:exported hypothetical protein [Bradyrhizobium sp. STM 3843]|uniref:hypothetical protein n=1 Tax=Bradyrhizobium sp. STM 3843 TaxID=551947 RepID=UPI00024038AF|nr:hypothetical protein [Bradyrhizobium sp. STM 3843]CCE12108.1 exported hypothetical protein [Bradyrhizobium sp. STM 3843]